jgi:hypothetical protein
MIASSTSRRRHGLGLLGVLLATGLAGSAQAQVASYGVRSVPFGYEDSYAGPLLRGDYIGAPLTRFPRPSELVPSAWGYGTYGVPTVAGIRSAPVGTPTVYVIEAPRTATSESRRTRARALSRAPAPQFAPVAERRSGSARVITVGVPQRQADLR